MTLSVVESAGQPLAANDYAWDGHAFWQNSTLRIETTPRPTLTD